MGVVTVRDPAGGVPKYLDGRFRHVLVVMRRAGLAKVLEHPGTLFACIDAGFGPDSSKMTQRSKLVIRPSSAATKHGRVGIRCFGHDAPQVQPDRAVHRPPEGLVGLYSAIKEPAEGT